MMMAKGAFFLGLILAATGSQAFADAKEDLQTAVKKLAESANYTWKSNTLGGFSDGPAEGQTEKNGYTSYSLSAMDSTFPVFCKGEKTVIKTSTGWQTVKEVKKTLEDAGSPAFKPESFALARVRDFKLPAVQLTEIAATLRNVKKVDEGFTGDLSPDWARQMITFRFPGSQTELTVNNPKGTIKVTVKDGMAVKYEINVKGMFRVIDEDRDVERSTVTEFTDIGTTKITVPDLAKKKLEFIEPPSEPATEPVKLGGT